MSTMSCAEFRQLVEAAVESRTAVDAVSLEPHSGCPECRALWEHQHLLDQAVGAWQAVATDVELSDIVLASLAFQNDRPSPRAVEPAAIDGSSRVATNRIAKSSRFATRPLMSAALVAAALVLMMAGWRQFYAPQPEEDPPVIESVAAIPERSADVLVEASDAEVETLLLHAGSAYRVLALDAGLALADASRLVSSSDRLPTARRPAAQSPVKEDANGENGWGRELEPIGRQFGEALEFLWEAVPPEPPPAI